MNKKREFISRITIQYSTTLMSIPLDISVSITTSKHVRRRVSTGHLATSFSHKLGKIYIFSLQACAAIGDYGAGAQYNVV